MLQYGVTMVYSNWYALFRRGVYASSQEELIPLEIDLMSLLPLSVVTVQLLVNPAWGKQIASRAVSDYALTQKAIEVIQDEV
jgi:hypothetical protein